MPGALSITDLRFRRSSQVVTDTMRTLHRLKNFGQVLFGRDDSHILSGDVDKLREMQRRRIVTNALLLIRAHYDNFYFRQVKALNFTVSQLHRISSNSF
jgi:hypothetical protein